MSAPHPSLLAPSSSLPPSSSPLEPIDHGVENESSTTSTHPSSLGGRPYTPFLPDHSSDREAKADLDPLRKTRTRFALKDLAGNGSDIVHQHETPESNVRRVPMP